MLTFEKVLTGFKDYLEMDKRYEILMTSHGYTVLEWDSSGEDLESATFCPTPERMKECLLDALAGYLEYKTTLCSRNLTDDERQIIQNQVQKISKSVQ